MCFSRTTLVRTRAGVTTLGACVFVLVCVASAAHAQWSAVAPGVELLERTDPGPRRVRALRISLCHPGVKMRASTYDERGKVTSSWGSAVGVAAAVNGGYGLSGYVPDGGFAVGNGQVWPNARDTNFRGYIAFGTPFGVGNSHISPAHLVEGTPADWIGELVNGDASLVTGGVAVNCTNSACMTRHPRTAAGFTQDKRTVLLAVVDGRSGSSIGMTINEMGALMKGLGAYEALNLDGGGSSTLWTKPGGVRNRPSDGQERRVSNHLGVFASGSGFTPHCPTGFRAKYVGSGFPGAKTRIEVPQGSTVSGYFDIQNLGTETWTGATRMGTQMPQDGASPVATDDWLSPARIQLSNGPIKTGEVGRFAFSVKSNGPVGTVTRQHFNMVEEGVTWFYNSWGPPANQMAFEVLTTQPRSQTSPGDASVSSHDASVDGPAVADARVVVGQPGVDAGGNNATNDSGADDPTPGPGLEGGCRVGGLRVGGLRPGLWMGLIGLSLLARTRRRSSRNMN